jgi:uncharacterized protein (TIGR01777 family)
MRILIAGASGFIGTALSSYLKLCGHEVLYLVRSLAALNQRRGAFFWDPEKGEIDPKAFDDVDAVINLAGENIGANDWTQVRKAKILESRLLSTKTLVRGISQLLDKPSVFISASAVGFYGDCGDAFCDEQSPQGDGFLADVCAQWEKGAQELKGVRVAILRFGIVLSPNGGMLKKLLLLFRWGLGARFGSGRQYMSWIGIDDLLSIFLFVLGHDQAFGILNAVSPYPVTNRVFTKELAKALHRLALFSIPDFILRLFLGPQRAYEMVLSSTRAVPRRLKNLGFKFQYADLGSFFRKIFS